MVSCREGVFRLLDDNRNNSHSTGPISPRGQEPHSSTGQTMVGPGPSPGQLVPSPSRDQTPTRDRQWSGPGHLVLPSTGEPALKWSQAVSQLSSQHSDPPVPIGQPVLGQARKQSGDEQRASALSSTPCPASRILAPSYPCTHDR